MRRDVTVCGITLIVSGVLIFVVSRWVSNNIRQCNGEILQFLSIACGNAAPLVADTIALGIVMIIIGIVLTIIGPLAPSKTIR